MKRPYKKYIRHLPIFTVIILLTPLIFPQSLSVNTINTIKRGYDNPLTFNIFKGRIEEYGNIKILHISGSYYEMGYQHGNLFKEEVQENLRAYLYFSERSGTSYDELLDLWDVMRDHTPQEIIDEMQGIADGSGLSFEMVAVANIIPVKYHCCGIAAWGSATADTKLYHARSLDYNIHIKDPETGKYLQENQILIVRKPDEGYASLYPGFAGFAGCLGGINENSIGLGQSSSWSTDETHHGTPMTFRLKLALDHAGTAEEAIEFITINTTCGHNYILSDGKIPIGYAVETTANISYVGTWNDTIESTYPCWTIDHVVRRTNFFVHPTTAATQRERYNPSVFLLWLLNKNDYFPYWRHYRTLSKGIEKQIGNINLNNTMSMIRRVYQGKTDVLIFIARVTGFLQTMHQWVACPETGDMAVSFASAGKNAFENPVYHFNLFQLLS